MARSATTKQSDKTNWFEVISLLRFAHKDMFLDFL
jgi:hypothetical protein